MLTQIYYGMPTEFFMTTESAYGEFCILRSSFYGEFCILRSVDYGRFLPVMFLLHSFSPSPNFTSQLLLCVAVARGMPAEDDARQSVQ